MHKAQSPAREIASAADVVEGQDRINFEDGVIGGPVRLVGGEG